MLVISTPSLATKPDTLTGLSGAIPRTCQHLFPPRLRTTTPLAEVTIFLAFHDCWAKPPLHRGRIARAPPPTSTVAVTTGASKNSTDNGAGNTLPTSTLATSACSDRVPQHDILERNTHPKVHHS